MKGIIMICLCAAAGTAFAQEEAVPEDLEARRQSVITLKQHLAMREKRLADQALRAGGEQAFGRRVGVAHDETLVQRHYGGGQQVKAREHGG